MPEPMIMDPQYWPLTDNQKVSGGETKMSQPIYGNDFQIDEKGNRYTVDTLTPVQKQIKIECDKLAEGAKNLAKSRYTFNTERLWFFSKPEMKIRVDLDYEFSLFDIDESAIILLLILLRACRLSTDIEIAISAVCGNIAEMLIEKNRAYGNSALSPIRKFSKASTVEQILVRLDDKLSRLACGQAAGEDVEKDLIGYLVLLRIARNEVANG